MAIQRILFTGGPGTGKSSVLQQLHGLGYEVGTDAARSIIRRRKQAGLSPRPDERAFAEQILALEVDAHAAATSSPAFFERGVPEAAAALLAAGGLDEAQYTKLLADYPYERVFLFPPWRAIYRTDAERDHTYEHCVRVDGMVRELYSGTHYEPVSVPLLSVDERVSTLCWRASEQNLCRYAHFQESGRVPFTAYTCRMIWPSCITSCSARVASNSSRLAVHSVVESTACRTAAAEPDRPASKSFLEKLLSEQAKPCQSPAVSARA